MGAAQWFDFGTNSEGITTYRVNAHQNDLKAIIEEISRIGFDFWEEPRIVKTHKDWTVLLKIFVKKDLGYDQESSI